VQANQAQIQAAEKVSEAHQQEIAANQAKVAANQAAITAANQRFGELGEYNILGEVTVYFANGKVALDPQYDSQLMDLASRHRRSTRTSFRCKATPRRSDPLP